MRLSARLASFLLFVVLLAAPSRAFAGGDLTGEIQLPSVTTTSLLRKQVVWNEEWPRVSIGEVMVSAAVTLQTGIFNEALVDEPRTATINFRVPLLDDGVRHLIRLHSQGRRDGAARLSDHGFRWMVAAPYLLDVGLGALVLNRNPDLALQLAIIDFQSLALAGMTQSLSSRLIGRGRPYTTFCRGDPEDPNCGFGPYRSFFSGHTMATFTAAGLVCVHHEYLPLYGGGLADKVPCPIGLGMGVFVGVLRVMADEHWTSDVLFGGGLGLFYGYLLPKLLHFHTKALAHQVSRTGRAFTWMPTFVGTDERMEAGITGTF